MKLNELTEKTLADLELPVDFKNMTIGQIAKAVLVIEMLISEAFSNGERTIDGDGEDISFPLNRLCKALDVDYGCSIEKDVIQKAIKECKKRINALVKLNLEINETELKAAKVLKMIAAKTKKPKTA